MDIDYEDCELVHVIKPFRLIDAESYERTYWRRDGVALAPGYYVVSWPIGANPGRFDEDAIFRGPIRGRRAAEEIELKMTAWLHQARGAGTTGPQDRRGRR